MSLSHVVAWIDHAEAHIIHFDPRADESEATKVASSHAHPHAKAGVNSQENPAESLQYYHDIAAELKDAGQILIVGPGMEKLAMMKHFSKSHQELADKVVSVETVDHPNDAQLLTFARKYFQK